MGRLKACSEDVEKLIAKKYKDGATILSLSYAYGLSRPTVYKILKSQGVRKDGEVRRTKKLSPEQIKEIIKLRQIEQMSYEAIARMYGVSHTTIRKIFVP